MERDVNVLKGADAGQTTWRRLREAVFLSAQPPPDPDLGVRRVTFIAQPSGDERVPHPQARTPSFEELKTLPTPLSLVAQHAPPPPRAPQTSMLTRGLSTGYGRRKSARAAVAVRAGTGAVTVNGRPAIRYFPAMYTRAQMLEPLIAAELVGRLDVAATVHGGGFAGQASAVRHALAQALVARDPELRFLLHTNSMLKRDVRVKERKHTGKRKARKSQQWVKR